MGDDWHGHARVAERNRKVVLEVGPCLQALRVPKDLKTINPVHTAVNVAVRTVTQQEGVVELTSTGLSSMTCCDSNMNAPSVMSGSSCDWKRVAHLGSKLAGVSRGCAESTARGVKRRSIIHYSARMERQWLAGSVRAKHRYDSKTS